MSHDLADSVVDVGEHLGDIWFPRIPRVCLGVRGPLFHRPSPPAAGRVCQDHVADRKSRVVLTIIPAHQNEHLVRRISWSTASVAEEEIAAGQFSHHARTYLDQVAHCRSPPVSMVPWCVKEELRGKTGKVAEIGSLLDRPAAGRGEHARVMIVSSPSASLSRPLTSFFESPPIVIVASREHSTLRYEDHGHAWQATPGVNPTSPTAAGWTLNREGINARATAARRDLFERMQGESSWTLARQAYVEFINEPTALPPSVEWATADR